MDTPAFEVFPIRSSEDIVVARQSARAWATRMGFSLVDTTKIVTATSELARNVLVHGGGGELRIESVTEVHRRGLRLRFSDQGPGIADISLALTDGFSTGGGMGLGLSGSRRLMNEFSIESEVGKGTVVTIAKWK